MKATDIPIGLAAGVIATGPMTLLMIAVHRQLPWHERHALPPRHITENLLRHLGIRHRFNRRQRLALTVAAHFGYGGAAGAVYAPLAELVPAPPVVSGIGYGLLVWAGSYMGLLPGMDLYSSPAVGASRRTAMMVAAHVVWGATLGLAVQAFGAIAKGGRHGNR